MSSAAVVVDARHTVDNDASGYERRLHQLAVGIEQLPSQFRGQLYGFLLTSALEQYSQADYRAPVAFERAWWGLTHLGREDAEPGLAMLRDAERLDPEKRQAFAEYVIGDIEREHRALLAPVARAIAPIIVSLPPASANELLTRVLSMVDAHADICVRDFLSTKDWRAAECARIFDHLYPVVMTEIDERNHDKPKRAHELADLAVLAQGLNPGVLYDRFNQVGDALDQLAGGADTMDESLLLEPLRHMHELAERLPGEEESADPSASGSSERSEAFKRLTKFAAAHNLTL